MTLRRHAVSVCAVFLALCGSAMAADVEVFTTGTNDTLAFRLRNTSERMRYAAFIEVTRSDLKTGKVISTRTDQHTLSPLADIYLGPWKQQGAAISYRLASTRLVNQPQGRSGPRDASLPAPYPVMFKK